MHRLLLHALSEDQRVHRQDRLRANVATICWETSWETENLERLGPYAMYDTVQYVYFGLLLQIRVLRFLRPLFCY